MNYTFLPFVIEYFFKGVTERELSDKKNISSGLNVNRVSIEGWGVDFPILYP